MTLLKLITVMVLINISSYRAEGAELRSTDTEGSITFTGGPYVPVGHPNPAPPEGAISSSPPSSTPANIPSGRLPQTSFSTPNYSFWIGLVFILLSAVVAYKKYQEEKISNETCNNDFNTNRYKKEGIRI